MKKKQRLNIGMAVLILLTVICGIMAVASVKGWFDGKEEPAAEYTVSEKTGIAMIERSGVAYEVTQGTMIRPEDYLYTKHGAALTLANGEKNGIYLNSNSEAVITETKEVLSFEVILGEAMVDARGWEGIHAVSNGTTIHLDGAAASISTQTGSTMVYVYAGEITLLAEGAEEAMGVTAGNVVTILGNGASPVTESLKVNSLNDGQIAQIIKCDIDETFCFTQAELEKVQEDTEETVNASKICTIQIVCDTILDNMNHLSKGKEGYVPSNGKILGTTTVEFSEGETVFDVLQRVCSSAGIQLEYSYTPIYESYYIEGINQLYEFDCGSESGWMYKVNGRFPNYGCSSYYLEDGDTIVWCYTCNGLGADVGA